LGKFHVFPADFPLGAKQFSLLMGMPAGFFEKVDGRMKALNRSEVEERSSDLLKKMSVREKVGQLNQYLYGFQCYSICNGELEIADRFRDEVKRFGGIGVLYGLFRADPWSGRTYSNGITGKDAAKIYNRFQNFVIENSRLHIPMLMSSECPHGHMALDGYLLPVNLAMGCTFDPALVQKAFRVCAQQMRAVGVHLALMSVLDVLRDPRWGRSEECYGEDPCLSARMAVAAVTGCQAAAEDGNLQMAAVAKHFCAQGQCTGGLNGSPASIGERELREIHLPAAWKLCRAGVKAIMAAYNEIDGIPCHANSRLLHGILRKEMGFEGAVMADGCAVDRLVNLTGDEVEAGALAINSGVDIGLWDKGFHRLEEAVQRGLVSPETLDRSVKRVLSLKLELGLFDRPFVPEHEGRLFTYEKYPESAKLASESVVLLKSEHAVLPLPKNGLRNIAVIGPNADSIYNQCGDYTPPVRKGVGKTILQGIREVVGPSVQVNFCRGCGITGGTQREIERAVEVAGQADCIILALGGSSTRNFNLNFDANGEVVASKQTSEMNCGEGADLADIQLGGLQNDLADAIFRLKKPTVTVLIEGRPHAVTRIAEQTDALLCAFYGGPQSGGEIAKILFGIESPSGRLSVSIPRSSGQIPAFYNYKPKDRKAGKGYSYLDMSRSPLYEFGFGLGYSEIRYRNFRLGRGNYTIKELKAGHVVSLTFTAENVGRLLSCAVPQLYISGLKSSITRRIRELKAFQKVWLNPGEKKNVRLELCYEDFGIWNTNMDFVVERAPVQILLMDFGRVQFSSTIQIC
jgi:beta-glucosidase